MGPFGVPELIIILVIVVIIFGVGKLPEIGGAFGKGIKEFKTEAGDSTDRATASLDDTTREKASTLTASRDDRVARDAGIPAGRQGVRSEDV